MTPWDKTEAVGIFLGAAVIAGFAAVPARRMLIGFGVLDRPSERSSHILPTARGGGVAILAGLYAFGGWQLLTSDDRQITLIFGVLAVIALVSFWDDLKALPVSFRFVCQAAAGFCVLEVLNWPHATYAVSSAPVTLLLDALCWTLMLLWLVGYTNAFNFMDGINGIAGGQAVITGIGTGLLTAISTGQWQDPAVLAAFAVGGAAAGFLPHNFPNARMFMGDVGSAPLGFLLAAISLKIASDHGWFLLIPLLFLHANFILDTGITLCRRIWRGENWRAPHREHFYQRLIRAGKGHAFVTNFEMTLQLLVLGLILLYIPSAWVLRVILGTAVLVIWCAFFWHCERTFQRSQQRLLFPQNPQVVTERTKATLPKMPQHS